MSTLNSKFRVVGGLRPTEVSALQADIKPKDGETPILTEGMIVATEDESGTVVVSKATSAAVAGGQPPDQPWLVIRGSDSGDSSIADKVTCVRLGTGIIFQVENSESFTVGDLCRADGGAIKPLTGAKEQAIGQVIGVDSANTTIVVAS